MSHPTFDDHCHRIKRYLGTAPEDGWIFGVCAALARRMGWELWAVRLVAAIALLVFTLLTVLVYFGCAMLMDETRPAAQRKLSRWARNADRFVERAWDSLSRLLSDQRHHPS